jgi:hypothetical protein
VTLSEILSVLGMHCRVAASAGAAGTEESSAGNDGDGAEDSTSCVSPSAA